MATIWKGSLTFGLVNVPVELKSAVKTDKISFRQLEAGSLSPIKYERVSAKTGDPVAWDDMSASGGRAGLPTRRPAFFMGLHLA